MRSEPVDVGAALEPLMESIEECLAKLEGLSAGVSRDLNDVRTGLAEVERSND